MKAKKTVSEANFKTFGDLDLSKIPGSVTEIFTTNFERFGDCRTFEDVVALCHELIDGAGLNTEWTRKFFYRLAQIKEQSMNPRAAFEKAMTFVNNTRMKGMGLGMGRGSGRFHESEDGSMKKQYTKKQIMEAIKHWTNVLKQMNESSAVDGINVNVKFKTVSPDTTAFWSFDDYDFGIKETTDALDIFRQWKTEIEKYYSENGFTVEVVSLDGPVHYDNEFNVGLKCLGDCDKKALEEFNELS